MSALLQERPGSTRTFLVDEKYQLQEVMGSLALMKIEHGILVSAALRVSNIGLECSSCLTQFKTDLEVSFHEEFMPKYHPEFGTLLPSEEDDFRIDDRMVLNITEALRQYLETEIPIAPRCQQYCLGLCSGCGQNLNTDECACKEES